MARTDRVVLVAQPGQQFKTRLPDDLHSRIKAAARANNRSANAELIFRLEASFERCGIIPKEIEIAIRKHIDAEIASGLREIAEGGE